MTCLVLVFFCKLVMGVFDLKIGDTSSQFDILHIVSLVLVIFAGWTLYLYKKQEKSMFDMTPELTTQVFDTILYFGTVVVGGKELNGICQLVGYPETFGVSFSVFMGIVSLFGVYYGLYKDKKYLRIEGFILLGFSLLKLFFVDVEKFDTIKLVIALVSLGIFMLVMAYLYQKIAKEKEKERLNSQPKMEETPSEPQNSNEEQPIDDVPVNETNENNLL